MFERVLLLFAILSSLLGIAFATDWVAVFFLDAYDPKWGREYQFHLDCLLSAFLAVAIGICLAVVIYVMMDQVRELKLRRLATICLITGGLAVVPLACVKEWLLMSCLAFTVILPVRVLVREKLPSL